MKKGDRVQWRIEGFPTWKGVVTDVLARVRWTKGYTNYSSLVQEKNLTIMRKKRKKVAK